MGVCLYFRSAGPVEPRVAAAIRRRTWTDRGHQAWVLCEPPAFYAAEEDGRLFGGSKLNLMPDPAELGEAEQSGAGHNDLDELLDRLCLLSRDHGINWELDIEGHALGSIVAGECDEGVRGTLEALAAAADDLDLGLDDSDDLDLDSDGNDPGEGPTGPRLWRGPEE